MKKITILSLLLFPLFTFCQWNSVGGNIIGEASNDESAKSISLNAAGNIIAIGAPGNDDNGSSSGHVRIYENIGGIWTQVGADIDGQTANDRFGWSVSLNETGTIVVIGAWANNSYTGYVRVYELSGGIWTQVGSDILGEAVSDRSGEAVSINADGTIVAIGARGNDGNGSDSGHVRVYENIAGVWTQTGADIDGLTTGDTIGSAVSINNDGSIVAIAGEFANSGSGLVRIYKNVAGVWTQMGSDINGESGGDRSGGSISISNDGTIVAIGARFNNGSNGVNSGHVRVYRVNASHTNWSLLHEIDGEDGSDNFGQAVSLSGNGTVVAAGAPSNSGGGHVRIFENGVQVGSEVNGLGSWSGQAVSLNDDGSILAMGNPNPYSFTGLVQLFTNPTLSVQYSTFGTHFSAHPNPTSNATSINLGATYSEIALTIYDNLGRVISKTNYTNTTAIHFDTSTLTKGVYIVGVQSAYKHATVKLVKK